MSPKTWVLCCAAVLCAGAIVYANRPRPKDDLAALRPYMESDKIEYGQSDEFRTLPGVTRWQPEVIRVRVVTVNDVDPMEIENILGKRMASEGGWSPNMYAGMDAVTFMLPLPIFESRRGKIAGPTPPLGKAIMVEDDPEYDRRFVIYETEPETVWEKGWRWAKSHI